MPNSYPAVEKVYDKYAPLVYGIALKIMGSEKDATTVLIQAFLKLNSCDLIEQNKHCLCATIIKLTIKTIREEKKDINTDTLIHQFKNSPILYKLLCSKTESENIFHIDEQIVTSEI
jgi:hypothetical protein